jgi:hypothetical protein
MYCKYSICLYICTPRCYEGIDRYIYIDGYTTSVYIYKTNASYCAAADMLLLLQSRSDRALDERLVSIVTLAAPLLLLLLLLLQVLSLQRITASAAAHHS